MKLLYVDIGHPILCQDHCLTWDYLGIDWRATGYYSESNGCGDLFQIKSYKKDRNFLKKLKKCSNNEYHYGNEEHVKLNIEKNLIFTGKTIPNIWNFNEDLINDFDVIFFNHFVSNIVNNLDVLKNKIVILNTYGMHNVEDETKIGMLRALKKIIRISNNEIEKKRTPLYGGHDEIIHGSVIPNEEIINDWNGNKKQVCTFTNTFNTSPKRREYYIKIRSLCSEYRFLLYGACNENEPLDCGFVNFEEKLSIMKNTRVHLITGTPGSSCTYSLVESMIMGAPTVCYGKQMWDSSIYEIYKLFNHGEDILIGETPEECSDYIKTLMQDKNLCDFLSKNARKKAINIYGRKNIAKKWKNLFNRLGFNI